MDLFLERAKRHIRNRKPILIIWMLAKSIYSRLLPVEQRVALRKKLLEYKGYEYLPDPFEPISINPKLIDYRSTERFIPEDRYLGQVKGGDWDEGKEVLKETVTYQGLKSRFIDGIPWEETVYFEKAESEIEKNGEFIGCRTTEEFLDSRCEFVEQLYSCMKENGFKSHTENTVYDVNRPWSYYDPTGVSVVIDRSGEIILHDGTHRVVLARILEIEQIPAHVLVRHKKWQKTRESVLRGEYQNQLNNHPDIIGYH